MGNVVYGNALLIRKKEAEKFLGEEIFSWH